MVFGELCAVHPCVCKRERAEACLREWSSLTAVSHAKSPTQEEGEGRAKRLLVYSFCSNHKVL